MIFTLAVFALLWMFQIFFLQDFYERMRIRSSAKSMSAIASVYNAADKKQDYNNAMEIVFDEDFKEQFYETVEDTASDNDICVMVLDKYGREVKRKHVMGECIVHDKSYSNFILKSENWK